MSEISNDTAAIREGEELDQAKLEPFLRDSLNLPDGEYEIEQFPGGHSNLTYVVKIGDTEMVVRRPPFGSTVKAAHDMSREYRILTALHPVYSPAPKPLVFCEDHSILGADFYAMERIDGLVMRKVTPSDIEFTPDLVREVCVNSAKNLAALHSIDWREVGLESLQRKNSTFVCRQVEGWAKRYEASKTHDFKEVEEVLQWCLANIPPDSGEVMIHNDYKFDNMLQDRNDISKIVGLLDWEMSTIGDPLFDLGCALSYWTNPEDYDPERTGCFIHGLPGAITREEFAAIYGDAMGLDVSNMNYYYVFAAVKLAVINQQIYFRYHTGLTKDERFAKMPPGIENLGKRAASFIESGGI
jgi:aminoglycoside phosphotransferase (APT) family kinase protein